ncbi:MAG: Ig-like domain-containing protein [Gemmatimonadaceae bacterium]
MPVSRGRTALAAALVITVWFALFGCSGDATAPGHPDGSAAGAATDVKPPDSNVHSRHVSAVSITPASASIPVGDTLRLLATLTNSTGDTIIKQHIKWTSSDSAVARVDRSGLVSGVAVGSVIITAAREGTAATAALSVVSRRSAFALTCDPSTIRLEQRSVGTLSCRVKASSGFSGSIVLSASHLPTGSTIAPFSNSSVSLASGDSTIVFLDAEVGATTAIGQYAVAITATGGGISTTVTATLDVAGSGPRVHMIYLLPSDVAYDPLVALGMDHAIRHLQIWYQRQMANGKTFAIDDPVVTVLQSTHPASYFATSSFSRAPAEVFAATGGHFNDSTAVWDIYLPVVTDGQGGTQGVALLGDNDVLGISGEDTGGYTIARWVGGLGHETGHAFGLPHPPGCDAGEALPDCSSLMYLGYLTYPDTFLPEADKTQLNAGPFFRTSVAVTSVLFEAAQLQPSPQP